MNTETQFETLKRDVDDEAYDIHIDRNGQWWHEGGLIKRQALTKLFASVLHLDEAGDYWLVTPAERGRITVEDSPFVIVNYLFNNNRLWVETNLGCKVLVSSNNPILLKQNIPYIVVRDNLLARVNRAVYYDLVELADYKEDRIYIYSDGEAFCIGVLD